MPSRAPAGRRRRSPAWRSPARPSPVAATEAAIGFPPGVGAERGSERPRGRGPARSPGRIAWFRDRSEGPVWREVGAIGSRNAPGAPQSPAGGRASRAAAGGRARSSGRQALATASPARGQDAASARRFHAGAEAVLPGAVALLGLVGLLHRACARSSPSGLGVPSVIRPQKARKRADRPMHGRGAFNVRRMIGREALQRQTRTAPGDDHCEIADHPPILPGSIAELPCEVPAAVLCFATRSPGDRADPLPEPLGSPAQQPRGNHAQVPRHRESTSIHGR